MNEQLRQPVSQLGELAIVAEIPRTATEKMMKATLRQTYKDWRWT